MQSFGKDTFSVVKWVMPMFTLIIIYLNKFILKVSLHPGDGGKSQKDFRQGLDITRSVILKDEIWWCRSWIRGKRSW